MRLLPRLVSWIKHIASRPFCVAQGLKNIHISNRPQLASMGLLPSLPRPNIPGPRAFAPSGSSLAQQVNHPLFSLSSPPIPLYFVSLPHYKQSLSLSWRLSKAVNVSLLLLHRVELRAPISGVLAALELNHHCLCASEFYAAFNCKRSD
jgi:hypothetical protein